MLEQIVQKSLAEEVYSRIRDQIFQNVYTPGEQLDIQQMATALGVSRQPVKDAVNLLSQEGLVEIRPRVGSFVRRFSLEDVREILQARLMIEKFAVQNAHVTSERIAVLTESCDRMDELKNQSPFDYLAYNEIDIIFHNTLVKLADNSLIENMYRQLNAHYVTARAFYANAVQNTMTLYGQHREIIEHLREGNLSDAAAVLERHILRAKERLLSIYAGEVSIQPV